MMEKSTDISSLATALAAAQAELSNVVKDAQNPHFRSSYATLAAVRDTVIPVLARNKIAVVQMPGQDGDRVTLTTVLMHASGEHISSTCSAAPTKADAQGLGSVVTYLRRYSLAAMAGIAQEDDDGQSACAPAPQAKRPPPPADGDRAACDKMLAAIASAKTMDELERLRGRIVVSMGKLSPVQRAEVEGALAGWEASS